MKKYYLTILFLSVLQGLMAQNETSVLRSSGKIYVVIGVILIIFFLIVLYLVRIDRKITKLEQKES
jgi:Kef-type K+ transport system membrane component KefB